MIKNLIWKDEQGNKVTCYEKIKVMEENLVELKQMAQDTYEDGILMGIDPNQLKNYLIELMHNVNNPYKK